MIPRGLRDIAPLVNDAYRRILGLPEQATAMARRIDALHYLEITIFSAIAVVFMVTTVWMIVRYRRRSAPTRTERLQAPRALAVYAIAMLGLFLAFWMISIRQFVAIASTPPGAMSIYVVAKQWIWKFEYPEGVTAAGILYVPAGRPVQLMLTSRDVIHSFYVPAFRLKQDVLPGAYHSLWFTVDRPGTYPVYCAELCGVGHSKMRAQVMALAPAAFDAWLRDRHSVLDAAAGAGGTDLVTIGQRQAAQHGCLNCHTTNGQRHVGPTWAGLYGHIEELEDGRVQVDPAYLTQSMMDPEARVVRGFKPVMPSFRGELEPAEVAALIEFIRSLRDVVPVPGQVVP